ncbi:thioesterase II family protein [Kitasatospora sp. NPDC127059]|uniref:thioesterase II family protein n=1 Tax=unclassified Kitasatospora TaxID=2633591 RepID=UPI00364A1FA5
MSSPPLARPPAEPPPGWSRDHHGAELLSPFEKWFPYRRATEGFELFAFPHIGAGPSLFNPLRQALRERDVAVSGALLPGRGRRLREQPHRSMAALVAEFEEAAEQDGFSAFMGDYGLIGHSSGSLVAFEIAKLLVRAPCRNPQLLVVCSCLPPQLNCDTGLSRLPTDEMFARTLALGGTSEAVMADRDFRTMLAPSMRADWEILDGYVDAGSEPLPVPVLAVRGDRDGTVPARDLALWQEHTSQLFLATEVAADHFLLGPDGSSALARLIPAVLAELPPA